MCNDGEVIVDSNDTDAVKLILNNANITSSTNSPINIQSAKKVIINLADGTNNHIADTATYVFSDPDEDEPNAAIFSKDDLTIYGNGSLTVTANYNDGIASKDGLIIASGDITVNSVDDGIRGKDYLVIEDADITINADGDGFKSDNNEDTTMGYIYIKNGAIDITSGGDAIQAETDVVITDGVIRLTSGGGNASYIADSDSAKGIKAGINMIIDNGNYMIDAADDAVHSNSYMAVNGGNFTISSGDDAFHADTALEVNNGYLDIIDSYEGIESETITINNGEIRVVSSDDGINGAGGIDGSGGDDQWHPPGPGDMVSSGDYYVYINGGYISVYSVGDGIDVNGTIVMTGGTVIVHGPTNNANGALDYDRYFTISGGILVAAGSSGMSQAPSSTSSQKFMEVKSNTTWPAETLIHIQASDGTDVLTFKPKKQYGSVVFSSPELTSGSYDVYFYGSVSGTTSVNDGLYEDGVYSSGTYYKSISIQ